ncbi:curlin [Enterobacteriaceae bacterium H20N1]|uniref:Curlin n=1 Tax=Dryocola boscaweniae TaxID=2925397 RepID=A0A9X3AQ12_9ENTR|nr:curlin [Dryocola boscaweniae]MCT4704286.1 curlin [Dryocola boscaweniae]MCT4717473.1 curlin [Dryocola boscaweniae]MCT4721454.1 curlin [Dryocola boscaweniae]
MNLFKVAALAALVVSGGALAGHFPVHNSQGNETLSIYQEGVNNVALADQGSSPDAVIDIKSYGYNNYVKSNQSGASDSDTFVVQSQGGKNTAITNQTADNSTISVTQVGWGNYANAYQH